MTATIEMSSVTKVFEGDEGGRIVAVDRMNLTVRRGQVVGLLGPAGCGKTTVLRMLACLETPTAGLIRLNGFDVATKRAAAAGQVAALFGTSPPDAKPGHGHAVAFDRSVALLDEPALALTSVAALVDAIRSSRITPDDRRTLVLATRDAALVRDVCDRAVVLDGGRIAADLALHGSGDANGAACYEVVVKGRLEPQRAAYFDGLEVESHDGETTISGPVGDQAALHGLLVKVRDLGLPLLSVIRCEPNLERILSSIRR
jgi:ABC-type multidrug transport system ATPase subunit